MSEKFCPLINKKVEANEATLKHASRCRERDCRFNTPFPYQPNTGNCIFFVQALAVQELKEFLEKKLGK